MTPGLDEYINQFDEYWTVQFADVFNVDIETLCKYLYLAAQLRGEQRFDH